MKKKSLNSDSVRIWDLPTRIFHVLFACTVTGAIVTAKIGNTWMDWHVKLGIASLALIIFRVIWGVVGPRYARFSQFVFGPVAVWKYLQSISHATHKYPGHNPLGGWSVVAMLTVIGIQAMTGLFANDEILTQGPLVQYVRDATSAWLTGIHQFNEKIVYVILGLHLVAILVYTVKGQKLIGPMIHGDVPAHRLADQTPNTQDHLRTRIAACILAIVLSYGVWWLVQLGNSSTSAFN